MSAFADLSEVINRGTGGNSGSPESLWFHKVGRVAGATAPTPVAGRWASLWTYDGQPSAGVAPGAVAIPDNTTTGGLKQTDPGGGRQKWLLGAMASGLVAGGVLIYDRLLHISGLSGTSTGAQTVGGSLTRYTDGLGNFVFAEIYTQIGASSTTITMIYTDQGGASSTSPAVAWGNSGFREQTRAIMLPLAAGDTGVEGVTSVTAAATTGTVGDFGVTVAHPLLFVPVGHAGAATVRDLLAGLPPLQEVQTDACLAMLWLPATTSVPELLGVANTVER